MFWIWMFTIIRAIIYENLRLFVSFQFQSIDDECISAFSVVHEFVHKFFWLVKYSEIVFNYSFISQQSQLLLQNLLRWYSESVEFVQQMHLS